MSSFSFGVALCLTDHLCVVLSLAQSNEVDEDAAYVQS